MKTNFNNYYNPQWINCPQDYVKVDKVIYDGTLQNGAEDFSLALISWAGKPTLVIRWNHTMREELDLNKKNNLKKCMGIPVSFAHPVWFVLPRVMHTAILLSVADFAKQDAIEYAKDKLQISLDYEKHYSFLIKQV